MVFHHREEAIFGLERLLMPAERLKDRLDYLAEVKNPQFGQHWDFKKSNNIHSLRDRDFVSWLKEGGKETVDSIAS